MTARNPAITSVSAFFPCYNDERSIARMVHDVRAGLAELVDEFEIIVIDDGSTDGSLAVLHALVDEVPELRVVAHPSNRGYGGALQSGFCAATKQWVFYTDGDAQYDATEVSRCVAAARDDVDIVQGFKIGRGDTWYRRLIGRAYHHTVKLLFGLPIRDTDCDFRLIRSSMMDRIRLTSTSGVICVELMFELTQLDARFVEVGVSHHWRPHGRSQFFRLPRIARSVQQLASLWWRVRVVPLVGRAPRVRN